MFYWVQRFFVRKAVESASVIEERKRERLLLETEARVRDLDHQLQKLLKEHEFRSIHKD